MTVTAAIIGLFSKFHSFWIKRSLQLGAVKFIGLLSVVSIYLPVSIIISITNNIAIVSCLCIYQYLYIYYKLYSSLSLYLNTIHLPLIYPFRVMASQSDCHCWLTCTG